MHYKYILDGVVVKVNKLTALFLSSLNSQVNQTKTRMGFATKPNAPSLSSFLHFCIYLLIS